MLQTWTSVAIVTPIWVSILIPGRDNEICHLIWPVTSFELAVSPNTHCSSKYFLYLHSVPGRGLVSAFLTEQGAIALCSVFYPTPAYLASYGSVVWLILRTDWDLEVQLSSNQLLSHFFQELSLNIGLHQWEASSVMIWGFTIDVSGDSKDWGMPGWLTSGNIWHVSFLLMQGHLPH